MTYFRLCLYHCIPSYSFWSNSLTFLSVAFSYLLFSNSRHLYIPYVFSFLVLRYALRSFKGFPLAFCVIICWLFFKDAKSISKFNPEFLYCSFSIQLAQIISEFDVFFSGLCNFSFPLLTTRLWSLPTSGPLHTLASRIDLLYFPITVTWSFWLWCCPFDDVNVCKWMSLC